MGAVRKAATVGIGLLLVGGAAVGTFLITRHEVPKADPEAAQKAAAYCIGALNNKLRESVIDPTTGLPVTALEAINPKFGKVLKAISIGVDGVEMVTADPNGENIQDKSFEVAAFFTQVFSLSKVPVLKIFGETSEPWLKCSKALAYYEQEQAQQTAADLQGWIFGPVGRKPRIYRLRQYREQLPFNRIRPRINLRQRSMEYGHWREPIRPAPTFPQAATRPPL